VRGRGGGGGREETEGGTQECRESGGGERYRGAKWLTFSAPAARSAYNRRVWSPSMEASLQAAGAGEPLCQ